MSHPIITDLEKRYTTKNYDATQRIPTADLEVIYEALRLSASSINSQPWKFVVIESDEAKQRFHDSFVNKHQFNQKHAKAASHIILFAHKTHYKRDDYAKVVDKGIEDGRTAPADRESAFGGFAFAELNTKADGNTEAWTKAQTYLALGNLLHTLARLGIDSTPLEGVDPEMLSELFKDELAGYKCEVGLAMGYRHQEEDYNATIPKSRLAREQILTVL
ncbi:Major NAD(P)H-flavin oxidoreductase [Marinomonas aquimarina]|uniref:Major NAD(P)H-flavin oxidoreductase n=1 Tax=Marinomonas aquimarina TaxID=295068 RepID=A0A1A8T8L3_9GAMM|nr:nitroreductase family protein [Marinomonas aquimarina]SBS29022.1 Major NAD(P)H-flavin oxidoreductase [Marinomonas aquimarina]